MERDLGLTTFTPAGLLGLRLELMPKGVQRMTYMRERSCCLAAAGRADCVRSPPGLVSTTARMRGWRACIDGLRKSRSCLSERPHAARA